jgi:DNA helicase-2/ATP-dependent DNA helicase PcrA
MFNSTEQQEREYIHKIRSIIRSGIDNTGDSVDDHVQTLKEYKEYLWNNKDIDAQEKRSMRESILNLLAVGNNQIAARSRLEKQYDSPYFGRIDFTPAVTPEPKPKPDPQLNPDPQLHNPDSPNPQSQPYTDSDPQPDLDPQLNPVPDSPHNPRNTTIPVYIGIHALYDLKKRKNLIYDWRAPVSGMFYDHELGEASYQAPAGLIEGNISLKRQYQIRKGILEYMIESSLTIRDDVLRRELSANASDKMKNIVATIQREQNAIIRNEEEHVLIIQGVAGSGKTSVALHRIAYLLYAHKGEISANDIMIISPSKVFSDYISNVLPELGEETVPQTCMDVLLAEILDNKYKYRDFFEQVAELIGKPKADFQDRVRFKSSAECVNLLDKYILHLENQCFVPHDVPLNHLIMLPAEYIAEQFRRFHRYPIRRRYTVMTDYILQIAQTQYKVTVDSAKRNMVRERIRKMFTANNSLQAYKGFYEWMGKPDLFKLRANHTLEYADLAPLAYLHMALEGTSVRSDVKHLLVDEMQDYTPIQYRVLQKIYPCAKTILGDAGQSVNPFGASTAEIIQKTLNTGHIVHMNKSYRSTWEITAFARAIQPETQAEVIERHGETPQILHYKTAEEEIRGIAQMVSAFKTSGYRSLGIICKDEPHARALHEKLKTHHPEIIFLSYQSTSYEHGIMVTYTHMAKGLEFDQVIIPHVTSKNYHTDLDRSLLYIAVTRAMHRLTCTGVGTGGHLEAAAPLNFT